MNKDVLNWRINKGNIEVLENKKKYLKKCIPVFE
jgi:hypothetical protein